MRRRPYDKRRVLYHFQYKLTERYPSYGLTAASYSSMSVCLACQNCDWFRSFMALPTRQVALRHLVACSICSTKLKRTYCGWDPFVGTSKDDGHLCILCFTQANKNTMIKRPSTGLRLMVWIIFLSIENDICYQ